ncbi:hypothetical protein [Paraliomyxa miuraensis]|uniref:hypothetical protein n=1 Tax=Paraliomyxa miuraensis TaxID=376150 RepID=UPI00225811B4|nr:hypothetical protein [Paraliomyxa miuraensis]MCX4245922.1 hypothetical protein [Paraliomyxa miuraensis]
MVASARAVGRLLRQRGPALLLYAAAVVLVPMGLGAFGDRERLRDTGAGSPSTTSESARERTDVAPRLRALSGIWWRYETGGRGERVRFYYFHGDGTGLYRYGRIGLTNTHGFDYDVVGDRLVLDFRKTGEHYEVPFVVSHGRDLGEDRDWLELRDDPREHGSTRYFRESDAIVEPSVGASSRSSSETGSQAGAPTGPPPAGHMWIDLVPYATGGRGFALYQLRPAGIDGRGVGWFHRGDFDDWSTEALAYRITGNRLELDFSLAGEHASTTFAVRSDAQGRRWLELGDDPRDFWHPHRYVDMGPSFGAALAPFELDSALGLR